MALRHFLCLLVSWTVAVGAQPGPALTVRDAPRVALAMNPAIATFRQQRGIAAAGVVLARIYPYNPILNLTPQAASGPAGMVTHPVTIGSTLTLELELFGQRRLRSQAAREALSRTEWEIAAQELALAGKAIRSFNQVVYREEKLKFLEAYVALSRRALTDIEAARAKQKEELPAGEKVLLRFEIQDAQAQVVSGRVPLVNARQELIQTLGVVELPPVRGDFRITSRQFDVRELQARAQLLRPDLHARRLAVAEGESKLRLERASRFGNPTVGPAYNTNETGIHYIGASVTLALPTPNRKQGEILLRQAELNRSAGELRQTEVQVNQEIVSALARLGEIQELIRLYRDDYLPALTQRSEELEKLYGAANANVDVQQVLELRRRLLRVRESYLDAIYEHGQIEVDLAIAVSDLELAFDPD